MSSFVLELRKINQSIATSKYSSVGNVIFPGCVFSNSATQFSPFVLRIMKDVKEERELKLLTQICREQEQTSGECLAVMEGL